METILENEFISILYYPEQKIIAHTVHQPISNMQLMEAMKVASNFLVENNVSKWLSDDRKNGPIENDIAEADMDYKEYNQRMIDAGWRYWANVIPTSLEAAYTLTPVMEEMHDMGLQMNVFTSYDEAFDWLCTVE